MDDDVRLTTPAHNNKLCATANIPVLQSIRHYALSYRAAQHSPKLAIRSLWNSKTATSRMILR